MLMGSGVMDLCLLGVGERLPEVLDSGLRWIYMYKCVRVQSHKLCTSVYVYNHTGFVQVCTCTIKQALYKCVHVQSNKHCTSVHMYSQTSIVQVCTAQTQTHTLYTPADKSIPVYFADCLQILHHTVCR